MAMSKRLLKPNSTLFPAVMNNKHYASVNKKMKARMEKCSHWCEFDDYTFTLEHWSNYDHATAWVKTHDKMYNVLWEARLTFYDGDKEPHEMLIVFDKTLSKTSLKRKPVYFSTVDKLLDKMEEKRQEFVKRQFKKAKKQEPYTRIIEHKWFNNMGSDKTIISREYSSEWKKGDVPYYPVNNEKNNTLYEKYKAIPNEKTRFVSRLGTYRYLDMDDCIEEAFKLIETL